MPVAGFVAGITQASPTAGAAEPDHPPQSFRIADASVLFTRRYGNNLKPPETLTLNGSGSATIEGAGQTKTVEYGQEGFLAVLNKLYRLHFFSMDGDYTARSIVSLDAGGSVKTSFLRLADAARSQVCLQIAMPHSTFKKCVTYDSDGPRDLLDLEGQVFREVEKL